MEVKNLSERLRKSAEYLHHLAAIWMSSTRSLDFSRQVAEMQEAADEIERLRAIVDKLPKCWRLNEQGELVQDEPVYPGMNVVFISRVVTNGVIKTFYDEVGILTIDVKEDCSFDIIIRTGNGDEWYTVEDELYLTREAAKAAKEKNQ
jgi:hypothetical protein